VRLSIWQNSDERRALATSIVFGLLSPAVKDDLAESGAGDLLAGWKLHAWRRV